MSVSFSVLNPTHTLLKRWRGGAPLEQVSLVSYWCHVKFTVGYLTAQDSILNHLHSFKRVL